MSDPNIKQIKLVGGTEEKNSRNRSKKNKKFELPTTITKEGGGSTSPGTMTQLASTRVAVSPGSEPVGTTSTLSTKGSPVQSAGSSTPMKVILGEAKKKSKVVLAAAKPIAPTGKTHKVKTARKVRVSMAGLSRKIKKAKTIRQKATGDSIESIKTELQKAGLIKAGS
jgi:hypothetical protein